jgi:hypothetical protein
VLGLMKEERFTSKDGGIDTGLLPWATDGAR